MASNAEADRRRAATLRYRMREVAERQKCPRCLRRAAMGERVSDSYMSARRCRYCGHEAGHIEGKSFGYDVTPEPGVILPRSERS